MMAIEERETMELDVVFIGAGPANLCAAWQLMQNIKAYNEMAESQEKALIEEPTILVIDKAANPGNHSLSGAVVDPIAFKEIFPEVPETEYPFFTKVTGDQTYRDAVALGGDTILTGASFAFSTISGAATTDLAVNATGDT
ncbi:hypothetical protein HQ520_01165, partial [bacterium]|nr:hypothetical protein [bacterium]